MPTVSELMAKVDTSNCKECKVKNEAPEKPETDVRAFGFEAYNSVRCSGLCKGCFNKFMVDRDYDQGIIDRHWKGISAN